MLCQAHIDGQIDLPQHEQRRCRFIDQAAGVRQIRHSTADCNAVCEDLGAVHDEFRYRVRPCLPLSTVVAQRLLPLSLRLGPS